MKKTLTVNLGGSVYHIDEDAYQELMDYLQGVKRHLGDEASSEEVLNDIEHRISELFSQWMQGKREVVSVSDVTKVIDVLGRPEQYENEGSKAAEEEKTTKKEETQTEAPRPVGNGQRKLYRDMDDALLGGVCSGLSIYLNVSPVLIRLLYFLLFWFGFTGLFVYIAFWLIIPEARTAAQRLEMRGEDVTIENIEKKVREGYGKVKDRVDGYADTNRCQTSGASNGGCVFGFFRICLKIVFAFFAGIMAIAVIASLIGLILSPFMFVFGSMPFVLPFNHCMPNPFSMFFSVLGRFLMYGIPLFAILRVLFGRILNYKPLPKWVIWVGVIFWLIGIGFCVLSTTAVFSGITDGFFI